jgi:hypothetical protein
MKWDECSEFYGRENLDLWTNRGIMEENWVLSKTARGSEFGNYS